MKLNVTKLAEQHYEVERELMQAIEKMQAGDRESFDVIYLHTQRFMFFKAEKMLSTYLNKDSELKADLVQDAYLKVFQHIGSLKEPAKFYGWLNMILVNTIYEYSRAHKKEVFDATDEQGDSMVEDLRVTEETPEDYVIEREKRDYINEALSSLPLEQRCAVELYYFSDMSVEEIAKQMQCSEGTIKSRLNYARKKIKDAIEEIERSKKIKLHSIFAIPVFLLLEREEAFAGAFDMATSQKVLDKLHDKCTATSYQQMEGEVKMNEQNMNQNTNQQGFQSVEEAAEFAQNKTQAMQAQAQAAGGTVTSVSTSIWTTTMGKIMVAIMITIVAVGTIWGGIYKYTQPDNLQNENELPVVSESDEQQPVIEESEDLSVEAEKEEPSDSLVEDKDDVIVEVETESEIPTIEDSSTEVYVETDPSKMTAKKVGTLTLLYSDGYYTSGSGGKTPIHTNNAMNIMSYNNGPSSVGNTDMEWIQHREEFEVDGATVPLWFYEGKRDYTEDMKWLTSGASDWNDNTRDETSWGKYNTLPQNMKEIFNPIFTDINDTYFLSEAELRSKANGVPEEGSSSVDSLGRVWEGADDGIVYYFENDKVVRLEERAKTIYYNMYLPNEQNPEGFWESEYFVETVTEDGEVEYYKVTVSVAYVYQYMHVNYYTGPNGRPYAAAYDFFDEVQNLISIGMEIYKMEP